MTTIDYNSKTVPVLKALLRKAHAHMGMQPPSFKGAKKADLVERIQYLRKAAETAALQLAAAKAEAKASAKGARATETVADKATVVASDFVVRARARAAGIRASMAKAKALALAVGKTVKVELNN